MNNEIWTTFYRFLTKKTHEALICLQEGHGINTSVGNGHICERLMQAPSRFETMIPYGMTYFYGTQERSHCERGVLMVKAQGVMGVAMRYDLVLI